MSGMDNITTEQFERISRCLPRQRGNVSMSNYQLVSAVLYVIKTGCKWRALPKAYGKWRTIYVRVNRWSKSGVLRRLLEALQAEGIVQVRTESADLDGARVKF
jgi:transposase